MRSGAVALSAVLFSLPSRAWAEEPRASAGSITWSAPPECPTTGDLRDEIDGLAVDPHARSSLRVVADVTHEPGPRYLLHLALTGGDGVVHERAMQGDTCREVFDAAAVVIAIAIHADVEASKAAEVSSTIDAPPTSDPSPPILPLATTPSSTSPEHPLMARAPWTPDRSSSAVRRPDAVWQLGALAGAELAALPAPTPGFGLAAALDYKRNVVELRFLGFIPQTASLQALPSVGGDLSLYAGSVRYCRSFFDGVVDVTPCAGIEAGAITVSSVGLAKAGSGLGPWLSPEISLRGSLRPMRSLAVTLEVAGMAPIFRPHFVITGGGEVFQPPSITGRALGGLHLRFP